MTDPGAGGPAYGLDEPRQHRHGQGAAARMALANQLCGDGEPRGGLLQPTMPTASAVPRATSPSPKLDCAPGAQSKTASAMG